MCNCIFMCLYINYNYLLWIHTCIQLALTHQVCASGLGCCGAGCGSSWCWMWGCHGAGCGKCSKQSAGHKALQLSAVVGCPCPLETLSVFLGRVAGDAILPSAVVGCPHPLETLPIFLGRVAGNAIQLSAVVGCPGPLATLSVFLGRVAGNAVSDWSSLASALLKIVL